MAYKIRSRQESPITLIEMKNWLKMDDYLTDDDELLTALIESATDYMERATNVAMRNMEVFVEIKGEDIKQYNYLPFNNHYVSAVFDSKDDRELDPSEYKYHIDSSISINSQILGDLQIYAKVGDNVGSSQRSYADFPPDRLPMPLKTAVMELVQDMYDNGYDRVKAKRTSVDRVIEIYRQWRIM